MDIKLNKAGRISGEITVSADKSISHRALILASLASGESRIKNLLQAEDINSTLGCMTQLGADIKKLDDILVVTGKGLNSFKEPETVLDCGNSGTTMRLLSGLLSGQNFFSVLCGDESLSRRPMSRVIEPLCLMGAQITGRADSRYSPLAIKGSSLKGITYKPAAASAQVKSALLLAGLKAEGVTSIIEEIPTRDHSERMLAAMGANLCADNGVIRLVPGRELTAQDFLVPGDISSSAFFMVLASIVPGSELLIRDVGINPTRDGILTALEMMGASLKIENQRIFGGEAVADILVRSADLKGITIEGKMIPRIIDELPVLAVAMAAAEGNSVVRNAEELRVKETDRIKAIVEELAGMGADIQEQADGFIIKGNRDGFKGGIVKSRGDHRIAMSLAIAAQISSGETTIKNAQAVNISFPEFWSILARVRGKNQ
ncbi:MAG TPA: 3-phosphoshikimate 1-carboxyvinyltransferase [Syntrophomonadaceae bacterium]|nr:3-phosphoshikimate 1-carboxyvinyltransferase [Syntrophomonadaceae bacterium]HNX28619.1 3-phosphoshikimate 1-carboxyvinyltransferase [Syntrophomonadaceae bacterium]HPR94017.1 3-phosphoshikimate 1-carboxyvinyltransferase [Syntrophomonadaceae bacterium]